MELISTDFASLPGDVRRDYRLRQEILWESPNCTKSELAAKEVEFIRQSRCDNPTTGYNHWPKFPDE